MKRFAARSGRIIRGAVLMTAMAVVLSIAGAAFPVLGVASARADDHPAGDHRRLNPCAAPSEVGPNVAETAWRLWVAATCPVNRDQYPYVVWEDWIEQAQMYPADPAKGLVVPNAQAAGGGVTHRLHGSLLALLRDPSLGSVVKGLLGGADENCNKAGNPPHDQPNLTICEEVRLGGATSDYIAGTRLWDRAGQAKAAADHVDIQFPRPAVEIKADWIELSSIGLTCGNLPSRFADMIHVETINGNCFALAGMHLISKLAEKWIWATFEPQDRTTNPNRCKVLGCTDPFGARPETTYGTDTELTPKLAELMHAAKLAPEWYNYRLDGVQTHFFRPELLGNSIIEGENAAVPLNQASCISCHAVSSVKSDGTDGITLLNTNPVGLPVPLPSDAWIRRDFVWSLSSACPKSPFQTCAP